MRLFVLGLLATVAALAVTTHQRATTREARALASHPPTGQFVTIDGVRIHAEVMGAGPDVVLIHGASGNLRDFTFALAPALASEFRVIALDRPGFGHSDAMAGPDISLARQARLLRGAADALGATRPLLVGQSYGGAVALAWALEAPPAALVLISAPSLPWPGTLDPWYQVNNWAAARAVTVPLVSAWVPDGMLRRTIDGVFAPDAAPAGYADFIGPDMTLRRGTLDLNLQQVNALRAQIVEMEPHYPRLTLPIEMIHGDADTIVPLHIHSGPLAPRLASARLTVLPGAGHMPHHTHLPQVVDAIRRAASRAVLP